MKGLTFVVLAAVVAAGITSVPADAKPSVALKMSGYVVQHAGNTEKSIPLEQAQPRPGDIVRYVVVASNQGSDPAKKLVVAARVPDGTSFEGGSATTNAVLHPQFSIDGGKTWAATPMVSVHTASGDVSKKADPSTYTSVRWIFDKPLAAHTTSTYTYEVRVK